MGCLEQRAVGEACERTAGRDPPHAGRGQFLHRRPAREREHVDGHADRIDDRAHLFHRRQAGCVDAVGACVAVGDEPCDRVVEVVHSADVVLGPPREHHRVGECVRGLGRLGDALGGEPDVVDPIRLRVVVLDREAGGACVCEHRHGLRDPARVVRIAALAVDVQRQRSCCRDGCDVCGELVARNGLVRLAERPGETRARRRECLEADGGEQPRRPGVPRIRHQEQLLARVELTEPGTARRNGHGRSPTRRAARAACSGTRPSAGRRASSRARPRPASCVRRGRGGPRR